MSPASSSVRTASPLGATWDGSGVDFALFSENATSVEVCLFDRPDADRESLRAPLASDGAGRWHVRLAGLGPGQLYGYRVHGPWAPLQGHRFNASKLLVDPRARAVTGPVSWSSALLGHEPAPSAAELRPSAIDSAPFVPKCVVVDPAFDWDGDRPLRTPWSRTVLYECHVKGMTRLHPDVPEPDRGKYLGLAHPAVIEHWLSLGATAISLMPVHHSAVDVHLASLGLPNYWGYATLSFFAPDARFASGGLGQQVLEFKRMIRALHRAGLEVVLDVVYNHTCETSSRGATVSLRGIDNAVYYRPHPSLPGEYEDFTGCGHTLNAARRPVLDLVLDSLRYWVSEMHVDGFRFDLAPVLGRDPVDMDPAAPFFERIREDPVLSAAKLIAEPWDLGPRANQLGRFPRGWAEWNGVYRDAVRTFWQSDGGDVAELSRRLSGSQDVLEPSGRGPLAGVNFVTCHDGFTLDDLVSYESKHNESNGEGNRDGPGDSRSRNWGVEGPSSSRRVVRMRARTKRNLIVTLALSQGVPMLSHGDELGRTQDGNNNAYCHDSELTWIDWRLDAEERAFLDFVRSVFRIRRDHAAFRRQTFLRGAVSTDGRKDVTWLHPSGREMTDPDWSSAARHAVGMLVSGASSDSEDGSRSAILLLVNGSRRACPFHLPAVSGSERWKLLVNTACSAVRRPIRSRLVLAPHSMAALELDSER